MAGDQLSKLISAALANVIDLSHFPGNSLFALPGIRKEICRDFSEKFGIRKEIQAKIKQLFIIHVQLVIQMQNKLCNKANLFPAKLCTHVHHLQSQTKQAEHSSRQMC